MEKKVLGRKEKITLPELGLNLVGAKIDSGAYTSSLHAEEIRIEEVSGKKLLYFKILMPDHQKYTGKTLAFDSFREKKVKNSFVQAEVRYLIETKKAAQSVVEAFHGLKARIIVQEYNKEAKGADIRAFVVHGKVVGAMKRQGAEGEFRSNLHRGGVATVIKLSRLERQAALNAAKALGLDVAGVDMLQSDRGPLILEVNSSPGLEGIEGATGINIAAEIVNFVVDSVLKKSSKRENQ